MGCHLRVLSIAELILRCMVVMFAVLPTSLVASQQSPSTNCAVAVLHGDENVRGVVHLTQNEENWPTTLKGEISGLTPGLHGFHVHQYGDNTNGCISAGAHFNPFNKTHGGPKDSVRHVGDLGNIRANARGVAKVDIVDSLVQIHGQYSVIGRALIVHANEDDLGKGTGDKKAESLKTGNAGARVACGVIAVAAPC